MNSLSRARTTRVETGEQNKTLLKGFVWQLMTCSPLSLKGFYYVRLTRLVWQDVAFLKAKERMDYSLILGVLSKPVQTRNRRARI